LTAADAALTSLRSKPQQLVKFEEALTLHKVGFICFVVSIFMSSEILSGAVVVVSSEVFVNDNNNKKC